MRLINADKLMEHIKEIHIAVDASKINTDYDTGFHSATSQIQGLIESMPTAYDIDKVIEQLEETFDKWGLDDDKKSIMREIVKRGGGNDYQTNPMKAVKTTSLPVKSNLKVVSKNGY